MKLVTDNRDVTVDGAGDEQTFQIKTTAMAFQILSSGLYKDKVLAVLRELSCNAWDAHTMAGNTDKPFLVQLPNMLEPIFRIRDYGTGLSHDDILNLYTRYFESTKSDTNDQIGALGLGSKSPFAYTDSFTVTSWFNGEKRSYIAFIGSNGSPQIKHADTEASDEPNGLEIRMTVESNDFREFHRKAAQVYKRFPLLPEVHGTTNFKLEKVEYKIEKDSWRIRDRSYSENDDAVAVMGCIGYPLESRPFGDLGHREKMILSLPIDIDFEIGDLEIAASREALSYTPHTQDNIKRRLNEIANELVKEIEAQFASAPSFWEACKLYHDLTDGLLGVAVRNFCNQGMISYKGRKVDSRYVFTELEKHKEVSIVQFETGYERARGVQRYKGSTQDNFSCTPSNRVKFVFDDLEGKKGANQWVSSWMRDPDLNGKFRGTVYLIRVDVPLNEDGSYPAALAKQLADKFISDIGSPELEMVSALPKLVKPTAGSSKQVVQTKAWLYTQDTWPSNDQMVNWRVASFPTDQELKDGGFYVHVKNRRCHYDDKVVSDWHILLQQARELGIYDYKSSKVYGFQASTVKKLANNAQWVNLYEFLKDKVEAKLSDKKFLTAMVNKNHSIKFVGTRWNNGIHTTMQSLRDVLRHNGVNAQPIETFVETYAKAKKEIDQCNQIADKTERWESIAKILGITIGNPTMSAQKVDFQGLLDAIKNSYPMLNYINLNNWPNELLQSVAEYVSLVVAQSTANP